MSTGRPREDRIEVRGLRLVATHGALAEERDRAQPFELDIDLWLEAPAPSDRLDDTVDYGAVVVRAAEIVRKTSFLLLESLAATVAEGVLDLDSRASRVAVTVRKLHPPIPEDLASVGVRTVRSRPEGGPPAS